MIAARIVTRALALVSLALPAAPAVAETPPTHNFTIGADTFTVTIPAGYCLPGEAEAVMAEQIAALDKMNITHAAFDRCGSFGVDYSHIKSPRVSEKVPLSKAAFVALAARQLQSASGQQMLDETIDQASRDIAEGTDNTVSLSTPVPRYAGQDADCAYMFIAADVVVGDRTVSMKSATCLTLVGGQFMSVHAYATQETGVTEQELKDRSRALAAAIKPKA